MKPSKLIYNMPKSQKTVALTKQEAQTLTAFRRTPYAIQVERILNSVLEVAREENETTEANEANRLHVQAVKATIDALFRNTITLK